MPKTLAMLLAGGRVDELGVLTFLRPKSTVPFGGLYRFIDFPLSNLMQSGIERVGILGQYRSSSLIEHIGTGASWDMIGRHRGITLLPPFQGLHASDWYKGTADAVYQNLDFIHAHKPDLILILSGDHIYHMDYQEIIQFHLDTGADVTASFVQVSQAGSSRFGLALISEDDTRGGRLLGYSEKPVHPASNWASMTIYLFKAGILYQALEENAGIDSHEFGRDIFPAILSRHKVYGYKFHGYWGYCRTFEEYWAANMDLLGEHPEIKLSEWQICTNLDHEAIRDRGPALIGPQGSIENSRLYNGVRIEGRVSRSILFPGAYVGVGAEVKDSILFFDTQIGPGARVERAITDIGASIGRDSVIGKQDGALTVIGIRTQIPQGITIGPGCSVHPELKAQDFTRKLYEQGDFITAVNHPV
ncbi:MAG: glucose-1-phosphate adenylyltransferase [Deltaproteobacteria bacterium]|nr:glucose-1-phosphate adenylyltransferase [Deltaproteobacteria bacterium]MBW1947261.1 glucose-1-phosphate adenylyltransferase [Deltaproteobacteria bacterium]MBW1966754.1 glucose-1-phosphate adenylyltransferase [Deltaproteobacteria bacterium]MBW2098819.1 glucose-1-phosphate adenylyltransferase [Deltaproteobacteria bacterium]